MRNELPESGKLLTPIEAASVLKVSLRTLANWRARGEGPRAIRLSSRVVRYAADDLVNR